MQKAFLFLIILLTNNFIYAQEGDISNADVGNSTSTPIIVSIDTNKGVGEIPLISGSTQFGSKTYQIPIDICPGMNGFQPDLSLYYDSLHGYSPCGQGWDISGISKISRSGKNVYFDGETEGILNDNTDSFLLDGIRLIKLNPDEDNGYILYQSEHGNIKVKGYTEGSDIKYFEVFYPNGNKGIFGNPQIGGISLVYPITLYTDPHGNKIKYEYFTDSNYQYISKISYNGASTEFNYSPSSYKPFDYSGGLKIEYTKNLSSIVCRTNTGALKCRYSFAVSGCNGIPLLNTVDYFANGTYLNPLKFYYGDGNSIGSLSSIKSKLPSYHNYEDSSDIKLARGKFNSHSKSDGIISLIQKDPYVKHFEKGGLFHHAKYYFTNNYDPLDRIFIYTDIDESDSIKANELRAGNNFVDIMFADIHGNQDESIIKIHNYVNNNSDRICFYEYVYNDEKGICAYHSKTFDFNTVLCDKENNKSPQPKYFFSGDFTGNGKAEIIAFSAHNPIGFNERPSMCYLFDLESNDIQYESHVFPFCIDYDNLDKSDKIFIFDYNGDGKSDICHIGESGMSVYSFRQSSAGLNCELISTIPHYTKSSLENKFILQGDVNGDGLSDFAISPERIMGGTSTWRILYSMGDGNFDEQTCSGALVSNALGINYMLQDINGDGKADLIKYGTQNTEIYLMEDSRFLQRASTQTPSAKAAIIPLNNSSNNTIYNIAYLDINKLYQYTYSRNYNTDNILTAAVNSMGVVEKNNYGYINKAGIESGLYRRNKFVMYPYINIVAPLSVLAKSEIYYNEELIKYNSYSYQNAIYNVQGKGFCGFEVVNRSDAPYKPYNQYFDPFNFGVLKSVSTANNLTSYSYSVEVAPNKIANVFLTNKEDREYVKGVSSSTSYTYNSYGYPVEEVITSSDGIREVNTYEYDNKDDINNPDVGYSLEFVISQSTTRYRGNSVCSEKVMVPSYSKGQALKRQTFINGYQAEESAYQYDEKGNLIQQSVRSYESPYIQLTTYTYDSYGQLIKETDPLYQSKNYSYNDMGRVNTVTDNRGNLTSTEYDYAGRETRISRPDGTVREILYEWCSSDSGSRYSVTETENGKPTVKKFYDAFNREISTGELRFDGSYIKRDKRYDNKDRIIAESLPYKSGSTTSWSTYEYDYYDRLIHRTEPTGKNINYSYDGTSVTEDDGIMIKTRTFDTTGKLISIVDSEGEIQNVLDADGKIVRIDVYTNSDSKTVSTSYTYDNYRRIISTEDPSFGISNKSYDSSGNLSSETDANGLTTSYEYDQFNRLIKTTFPEFETSYVYNEFNDLVSQISSNETSKIYAYDGLGRVISEKENSGNSNWLQKDYTYSDGNIATTTYTSNFGILTTENYTYTNGQLTDIYLTDGTLVFHLEEENAFGHPIIAQTGDLIRKYSYDEYGLPDGRIVNSQEKCYQDEVYYIQPHTSNLMGKTDNIQGIWDSFDYDNHGRLIEYNGETTEYSSNGNIIERSDIGGYRYSNSKPYAINGFMSFNDSDQAIRTDQEIEYTSFSRPSKISENNFTATFEYNANGDRTRMSVEKCNARDCLTRHYLGGCYECDQVGVMAGNQVEKLYLMGNYYTSPSVLIRTFYNTQFDTDTTGKEVQDSIGIGIIRPFDPIGPNNPLGIADITPVISNFFSSGKPYVSGVHQILRDYLGSIKHVIQPDGTEVETLDYDAWGRIILPDQNGRLQTVLDPPLYLGRGYTGHEDLHYFGLINMNARLYDPLLGRFLSPDPELQDPENLQNYNKYTYALNNPLKYNDPNGEFVIGIGSVLSCVTDLIMNIFTRGVNFHHYNWLRTRNAWKIDAAMFAGNFFQILNKWSPWNFNNSMIGKAISQFCNFFGMVDNVTTLDGMAAVGGVTSGGKAFTIGHYSIGPDGYTASWKDHLFVHEYGHYMQSQIMGPFYLGIVGIPSLISASGDANQHRDRWFEQDASERGGHHFDKKYGHGITGSEDYFDFKAFVSGEGTKYANPRNDKSNLGDKNPISGSRNSWWQFLFVFI